MADSFCRVERSPSGPRVLVAQIGSRGHYLAPRVLARRGMLARFVTDLWCPAVLARSRVAAMLGRAIGGRFRASLSRRHDDIPDQLVSQFPWFAWQYIRHKARAKRSGDVYRAYCWGGRRFCELASRLLGDSSATVYAFTSAALELFEAARSRAMRCVLDHASGFVTVERQLYNEQWRRYPDWGAPRDETEGLLEYAERQRRELALADIVLAPSTFAKECLVKAGADAAKLMVLPLAFTPNGAAPQPEERREGPLRVLFAARQALLKGLPDLVEALKLLPPHRFIGRVVGIPSLPRGVQSALPPNLELVGEVGRSDMPRHYGWADVFVFPTVCDTFGFVILEAMAAGLPVIATPHSAASDIVREGEDGFLVPVGSPERIAESLDRLETDRVLLLQMKRSASSRAEEFGQDGYADRLAACLDAVRIDQGCKT